MTNRSKPMLARMATAVRAMAGGVSVGDVAGTRRILGDAGGGAGVRVDHQSMLTLSAAWACVRLISETIATLPLGIYERGPNGKRAAPQHRLHFILHDQPNVDSTASVFWEAVVAAMLTRGRARAEKLKLGDRVVGLRFLAPSRLSESKHLDGTTVWRYAEKDGRQRIIPDADVWRIPGFSLDGEEGVSVIQYGSAVFGGALAADKAANNAFRTGRMQSLYYKVATFLTKANRDSFLANLEDTRLKGGIPLLEGGTDIGDVGMSAADAQLLESRGYSVEEVCRWFRVPPWMVGHTEKTTSWGSGIEQQMIGFLTFTLGPWLKRIEQAISKDLLSPAERVRFYAKFAVEGLLRADTAARAAFYTAMVNNGIFTRDEIRQLEDREPLGGNAAVLTVQSAMTTLDAIGQGTNDSQQVRAALRAWLGLPDEPQKG